MLPAKFETAILASKQSQTHALDRAATGSSDVVLYKNQFYWTLYFRNSKVKLSRHRSWRFRGGWNGGLPYSAKLRLVNYTVSLRIIITTQVMSTST